MLQLLVTGNLAVFLSWVWLDALLRDRKAMPDEARVELLFQAMTVAGATTFGGAAWAGMIECEPFLPFLLCIAAPVLLAVVPFLWLAVRRIPRPIFRALLLAGVVMMSAIVQHGQTTGNDAELSVFTLNSLLIGLAIVIWLLTWSGTPDMQGSA